MRFPQSSRKRFEFKRGKPPFSYCLLHCEPLLHLGTVQETGGIPLRRLLWGFCLLYFFRKVCFYWFRTFIGFRFKFLLYIYKTNLITQFIEITLFNYYDYTICFIIFTLELRKNRSIFMRIWNTRMNRKINP